MLICVRHTVDCNTGGSTSEVGGQPVQHRPRQPTKAQTVECVWSVCGACVECVRGDSAGNQIEKRGTTDGPPAGADEADEDAAGSASIGFLSEFRETQA